MDTPFPFSGTQQLDSLDHCYVPSTDSQPCKCSACADLVSLKQTGQDAINEILTAKRKINFTHSAFIRIPVEVKVKIFEYFIQGPDYSGISPLKLGAICRDWRLVAWDAPSLWGSLSIKLDIFYSDKKRRTAPSPHRLTLIKEWLVRSTTRPLSLNLSLRTFQCKVKNPGPIIVAFEVSAIIDLVTRESYRWQDLRVSLPRVYLQLLEATLEREMRMLQSVEVGEYYGRGDVRGYRLAIADAPNLRKVVLHSFLDPTPDLPWAHLTHLVAHEFSVETLLRILNRTLALEDLRVDSLLWLRDDNETDARPDLPTDHPQCIHLPRLRALYIHSHMGEGYRVLIPLRVHTYMPALEELEFEGDEAAVPLSGESRFSHGPVFKLASRYRNTLQRLAVRKVFFRDQRVIDEDLSKLHKLRELEIDAASMNPLSTISGAVLRALSLKTYDGGDREFLPNLEVLSLTGMKDFGWDMLVNIFPDTTASGKAATNEIPVVRAFRSVKIVCLASVFRKVEYIHPDELWCLFAVNAGGCRLEVNCWEWDGYECNNHDRRSRPGTPRLKSDWLEASVERWQENIRGGH